VVVVRAGAAVAEGVAVVAAAVAAGIEQITEPLYLNSENSKTWKKYS
jgi:hypothetical protein